MIKDKFPSTYIYIDGYYLPIFCYLELQTSREDFEKRVGLASTRPKDTDSEGSDSEPDGVPPECRLFIVIHPLYS